MGLLDKIFKNGDKKENEIENKLTPYEDACSTYRKLMAEYGGRSLHGEADRTRGKHGMCSRVRRGMPPRGGR